MKNVFLLLAGFFLFSISTANAQQNLTFNSTSSWESDSSFLLKNSIINFGNPQLINLTVVNKSSGYQHFFLPKGLPYPE